VRMPVQNHSARAALCWGVLGESLSSACNPAVSLSVAEGASGGRGGVRSGAGGHGTGQGKGQGREGRALPGLWGLQKNKQQTPQPSLPSLLSSQFLVPLPPSQMRSPFPSHSSTRGVVSPQGPLSVCSTAEGDPVVPRGTATFCSSKLQHPRHATGRPGASPWG